MPGIQNLSSALIIFFTVAATATAQVTSTSNEHHQHHHQHQQQRLLPISSETEFRSNDGILTHTLSSILTFNDDEGDSSAADADADAETVNGGNPTLRRIYCGIFLGVVIFVILWAIWVFRKELARLAKEGCLYMKGRSSGQQGGNGGGNGNTGGGTLNDIIFDPEEEQAASLAEPLLDTSNNEGSENE